MSLVKFSLVTYVGWKWYGSMDKLWHFQVVVFKFECTLKSHERIFKTQIPGFHASMISWSHSLWTDRMAEWTIVVYNCPIVSCIGSPFWGKSANSRDQEKYLEENRNGKKQSSLHFLEISFLQTFGMIFTRLISVKFKLLLTPVVEASHKNQSLLPCIPTILSF